MRTYERTHPWLKFVADLSRPSIDLWLMLGECQSKCEHVARVPLRPDTASELYKVYLAKGALATTAIEGNTLSEHEVMDHLDGKLRLPPSRSYLAQEIDNIIAVCKEIFESVAKQDISHLTVAEICGYNRTVLRGLELEGDVVPGQARTHSVSVGRYQGAPAEDCDFLLEKLVSWLNSEFKPPSPDRRIVYAILKAVLAHLYLAWIHPFGDGNGRTARLLEFRILLSAGVPAVSAHLLSNHYNLTRTEYYRQLDQASKSGGEIVPFVFYAVRGLLDGLVQQIDRIWVQQWDIAWRNYVHESFREKTSASEVRRRHLVLDLSRQEKPVPVSGVPDMTPRLAKAFAGKTRKTLTRDLNAVCKAGLVEKTEGGYRAKKELILAFLPPRFLSIPERAVRDSSGDGNKAIDRESGEGPPQVK